MKILERRREADHASARARAARLKWRAETVHLQALAGRHRALLTVGGGFLSGVIAAQVPWRGFARVGSFLGAMASLALRSPLGVMLFEGVANAQSSQSAADDPAGG